MFSNNKTRLLFFFMLLFLINIYFQDPIQWSKTDNINPNVKRMVGLSLQNPSENNGRMKINLNPVFGGEFLRLTNHTGGVRTIAFSPDGQYLASGGNDLLIKVWNVEDGEERYTLRGHTKDIASLAFSPDNRFLASSGLDLTIKIWNMTDGKELKTIPSGHDSYVLSLAFSHHTIELISGGADGLLKVWKWNSTHWAEKRSSIDAHDGGVTHIHYSFNGTLAVTSGLEDKTIKIWNTTSWENILSLTGHTDEVIEAKFSPDGTKVASVTSYSDVWLWDLSSGVHIPLRHTVLSTKKFPLWGGSVDFSPDGMLLASGGRDGLIKLWNVTTEEQPPLEILSDQNDVIGRVIFSPDGTLLASCGTDSVITLWSIMRGARLKSLFMHESTVTSVEFSPDGTSLASASDDKTIIIWNATSGKELRTLRNHTDGVNSVSFDPDGSILASCSNDKTINLWNVSDGTVFQVLTNHTDWISSVDISSDGKKLASGAGDTTVKLWNMSNGVELQTWEKHSGDVTSVAFSPDSTKLASSSADDTIRIWDVEVPNENSLLELTDHTDDVKSITYSPSGNVLASGSYDKTIILWDLSIGVNIGQFDSLGRVQTVEFSPDGSLLASGTTNGYIQIWDVDNRDLIKTYYLHRVSIRSIAFSPNGYIMVSGDTYASIEFWDLDATPDFDGDGMPDDWEIKERLDPSNFYDKFYDTDNDGLPNSLEWFLHTIPSNADSDNDSMPDGWEYLGGTDPTEKDADNDLIDGDGMPALYEFRMGLNPRFNDSGLDNDNDTLTNLKECEIGTWANQSDTDFDRMSDDWEYKYGGLKCPNPLVADDLKDPDGDGVPNIREYKGFPQSDPRNFFSVPFLSFSFPHLIVFIVIVGLTIQTFIVYRRKLRQDLIKQTNAPDYQTALQIRSSGFSNYSAFMQAHTEAQELVSIGKSYYYQGLLTEAIQRYEQAMTLYERLGDKVSIATSIFWAARAQKDRQELTANSSILKILPSPYEDPKIEVIDHILQALLAEANKNWGLANESWQAALDYENLDLEFRLYCQRAVLESRVKNWMEHPEQEQQESLSSQLTELKEECKANQYFEILCQVLLNQAKFSFASAQFDEVEERLHECSVIAEENNLLIYQEAIEKEKAILLRHRARIQEEIDKLESPEEQMKVMQDYIKEALKSLREEELI